MADEDKQFDATPQKLKRAREEGQVAKSQDFSMAISLLVMFMTMNAVAPMIWKEISKMFILIYEQIPNKSIENIGGTYLALISILPMIVILGPLLFLAMLVSIISDLMQIGPLVSSKAIEPKFDKLNPFTGFKNRFMSIKTYFDLAKNVVKVIILGFVAYITFKSHIPSLLNLCAMENTFSILMEFGKIIIDFVIKAGILFLVIAGADYLFTRWKFLKDQKMSFKEIKDEYKNTEGDPHVKAALRQKRMQMMQRGMQDAVTTADFVTTNPTHVAVAIKYTLDDMKAPKVVAKGSELFAKKIIEIAKRHNVPVIENPPVARALYRLVEVNKEIPPELYKAVAEILLFVYNLHKDNNIESFRA